MVLAAFILVVEVAKFRSREKKKQKKISLSGRAKWFVNVAQKLRNLLLWIISGQTARQGERGGGRGQGAEGYMRWSVGEKNNGEKVKSVVCLT